MSITPLNASKEIYVLEEEIEVLKAENKDLELKMNHLENEMEKAWFWEIGRYERKFKFAEFLYNENNRRMNSLERSVDVLNTMCEFNGTPLEYLCLRKWHIFEHVSVMTFWRVVLSVWGLPRRQVLVGSIAAGQVWKWNKNNKK